MFLKVIADVESGFLHRRGQLGLVEVTSGPWEELGRFVTRYPTAPRKPSRRGRDGRASYFQTSEYSAYNLQEFEPRGTTRSEGISRNSGRVKAVERPAPRVGARIGSSV